MQFEFILSLAIFLILSVIAVLWQPTRVILKAVFKNPLRDTTVKIVSDYKADEKRAKKVPV